MEQVISDHQADMPSGSTRDLHSFAQALGDAGLLPKGAVPATFRDALINSGLAEEAFADHLAAHFKLPRLASADVAALPSLAAKFTRRFLVHHGAYPFEQSGEPVLAVAEPPNDLLRRAARLVLGVNPTFGFMTGEAISRLLGTEEAAEVSGAEPKAEASREDIEQLRDLASGAPVVRALDDILRRAVEARATDLHIEPSRERVAVRMRIDGILRPLPALAAELGAGILSRIKILSGLDIAERRLPQDGAMRMTMLGAAMDIRVAVIPAAHGEAAVLRLLVRQSGRMDYNHIGLRPDQHTAVDQLLAHRTGMVIVTGPTGSGKTTTLATFLHALNQPDRKILTVEDPVEYEIPGIVQTQVNTAVGLTFAKVLRSFLRSDPNVIMVGEIRDSETASIAVQAALTGHLVLTTLHTDSAAGAIPRLIDLGVEDFLLRSTLRGVLAQRLVRRLCDHCKRATPVHEARLGGAVAGSSAARSTADRLGLAADQIVCEPVGCERCGNSGYRGRTGIFEILSTTPDLRDDIRRGTDSRIIEDRARKSGYQTLLDDAGQRCRDGVTSVDEVLRVLSVT